MLRKRGVNLPRWGLKLLIGVTRVSLGGVSVNLPRWGLKLKPP